MKREEALALIEELISVETQVTKEANFRKHGVTKQTLARELRAIDALMVAMGQAKVSDLEYREVSQ